MARSPKAKPTKRIAAIVCTYNHYDTLRATLAGLGEQSLPSTDYEIVLVDNSSNIRAQRKFWKGWKGGSNVVVRIEPQPGLSRARNVGVNLATAPLVAFIDDDAIPSPGWLEAIVAAFDGEPKAGVVGGPVAPIWPDAPPKWLHPSLAGFYTVVEYGTVRRLLNEDELLAGTNVAFRREPLINMGGLSEVLGRKGPQLLPSEYLEIVRRIRGAGLKVLYEPRAAVQHRVDPARINHAWLRRRVAWRAVSNALAPNADGWPQDLDCWDVIARYALNMPPEMRGLRGLFFDTDDPAALQRQCDAIAALMMLMMNDARDPEAPR